MASDDFLILMGNTLCLPNGVVYIAVYGNSSFLFKKNISESIVHVKSYSYLTICIHSGLLLEFIFCLL